MTRWYWAIAWANTIPHAYCSSEGDLKSFTETDFDTGLPIDNWDPTAWIKATKPEGDGEPDDVLQNHFGLKIYSWKLRTVLEIAYISGIQFLPIRTLRRSGQEIPGFSVANILNMPAAMDLRKSEYDVFEDDDPVPERHGQVSGVYKMVLKRSALSGLDIILPREFARSPYVSEKFKRVFEAANCTGYEFKEVSLS